MFQAQTENSRIVKNQYVRLDEEGYLIDPNEWEHEFTETRALEAGIKLQQKHWLLINIIRDKYLRLGSFPPMRIVSQAVASKSYRMINGRKKCRNGLGVLSAASLHCRC